MTNMEMKTLSSLRDSVDAALSCGLPDNIQGLRELARQLNLGIQVVENKFDEVLYKPYRKGV